MSGTTSGCVVGVGFREKAPAASIIEAVRAVVLAAGEGARMLAVPADKAQALREAALELGLAIEPISPEALRAADAGVATRSAVVAGYRGVGSVCEAAALAGAGLAGAGADAHLLVPRIVSADGMATAAAATRTKDTT